MQLRPGAIRLQQERLHSLQAGLKTAEARLETFGNLPPHLETSRQLYKDKVAKLHSCLQALEECLAKL